MNRESMETTEERKRNTAELLNEIYRNASMGSENVGSLTPLIRNRFLMTDATAQMEKYSDYTMRADALLKRYAVKPEKLSVVKKLTARTEIAVNTLFDSSDANLADMIARGTTLGADDLERTTRRLESGNVDPDALRLAREVAAFERAQAEKMKRYR